MELAFGPTAGPIRYVRIAIVLMLFYSGFGLSVNVREGKSQGYRIKLPWREGRAHAGLHALFRTTDQDDHGCVIVLGRLTPESVHLRQKSVLYLLG